MIKGITENIIKRVYDFSEMTDEELRCKFFQKLEECIDLCNNSADILDWLKNEGLENELNELLNIWKDDGTLDNIINNKLFNELNTKIENYKDEMTNDNNKFKDDTNNLLNQSKTELNNTLNNLNKYSELHYLNTIADEMCVLLKCKNGEIVLIDCNETFSKSKTLNRLQKLGISVIDHFIITHFHSDHVGGFDVVLNNFQVKNVYYKPINWALSQKELNWNTKSLYEDFLNLIKNKNIVTHVLSLDTEIKINKDEKLTLLNTATYPYANKSEITNYDVYDYNYESLIILYENKNVKILFEGDCPTKVAYDKYGNTISNIDHLQISHHGGNDVMKIEFVNSLRAKSAYYSFTNSTNIEYYKAYTLTKIYTYDYNVNASGSFLITDTSICPTLSFKENTLSDKFLSCNGKEIYVNSNGDLVENGIIYHNGSMYIIKNWYKQLPSGDGWYYPSSGDVINQPYAMYSDGRIKTNQWINSSNGKLYYVNESGIYYKDCTVKIGTQNVTFDKDGLCTL